MAGPTAERQERDVDRRGSRRIGRSPTGRPAPSTGCPSPSSRARCSGWSGPTAPARRRPSSASKACATRMADASRLGLDPGADRRALTERIGIQLQQANLPPRLRSGKRSNLFAAFYPRRPHRARSARAPGALREARRSGRQALRRTAQRLFIALALVNHPELVFLDELTTGLDPQARRSMWDLVRELRQQGTDGVPDHPLHGGGRAPVRPRGHPGPRPDRGARSPRGARSFAAVETRIVFTVIAATMRDVPLASLAGVHRVETSGERVIVAGVGRASSSAGSCWRSRPAAFRSVICAPSSRRSRTYSCA